MLKKYGEKFRKNCQNYRRYLAVLLAFSMIANIGVNWGYLAPDVSAMSQTEQTESYTCGKTVHTHSDACYTRTLACGQEESAGSEGHTHTDACYQAQTLQVCTKAEHTHAEGCYDENGNLTCSQEEHTHSDSCYQTQQVLSCGQEESGAVPGHTHTDACYESQLTCGQEEHTHTEECLAAKDTETQESSEAQSDTGTETDELSDESDAEEQNEANDDEEGEDIGGVKYLDGKVEVKISNEKTEFYTGQAAETYVAISNPTSEEITDGAKIRVYMQFTDATLPEGAVGTTTTGTPSTQVGSYKVNASNKDGETHMYSYTVSEPIATTNTYCFEFERPVNGDTIAIFLNSSFANALSAGGTNKIWAEVVDANGKPIAADKGEKPEENEQTITWATKPDDFTLTKTTTENAMKFAVDYDEETENTNVYLSGVRYTIDLTRSTEQTLEGIGKDNVARVEYTDTLTLPEGVGLTDAIKAAIDAQTYSVTKGAYGGTGACKTEDGTKIFSYDDGLGYWIPAPNHIENVKLSYDENHLYITFSWENGRPYAQEINAMKQSVTFGDTVFCLTEEPIAEKEYTLINQIQAKEIFNWSVPQADEDSCSGTVKMGEGNLILKKKYTYYGGGMMGSAIVFRITASNTEALSYNKMKYIEDPLAEGFYMSAADLAQLFVDDKDARQVAVTIKNANICTVPDEKTVTTVDGTTTENIAVWNTSPDGNTNKYNGMQTTDPTIQNGNATITLAWSDSVSGKIAITYDGTTQLCSADEGAIQKALDAMGFTVVKKTTYTVKWKLCDEDDTYILHGGQTLTFDLPVHMKDTTQLLTVDERNTYHTQRDGINNWAYAYQTKDQKALAQSERVNLAVDRELSLYKTASVDGTDVEAAPGNHKVIDYKLQVSHKGLGNYALLPVTDHISGAQMLLAEVSTNQNAEWAGSCDTVEVNEIAYYILKPGTYSGVWLGDNFADSVTVAEMDGGWNTLIKWYMKNVTGSVTKNFTYKVLVDTDRSGVVYSLNNESWLNDHETHRLYDTLGWEGLQASFAKKIVSAEDIQKETGEKEEGTSYQAIEDGDTIYYRIGIQATENDLVLNGTAIEDTLPRGLKNTLTWKKAEGEEDLSAGSVDVIGYQNYSSISGEDSWSVTDSIVVTGKQTQQNIVWGKDFSVTIAEGSTFYIYIRLTFPKDADFQDYAAVYSAIQLENTFSVYGHDSTVYHDLKLQAKAYLQKGIYEELDTTGGSYTSCYMTSSDNRDFHYYSNNNALKGLVIYYVALYNGGNTRLYLQDMQDTLPQGFTFKAMGNNVKNTDYTWVETNRGSFTIGKGNPSSSSNPSMYVTATVGEDPSKITFKFTKAYYTPSGNIDKDGRLYLNPGERVAFSYQCWTNKIKDTEDAALNRVVMPYYDYTGAGVTVPDNVSATTGSSAKGITPNDGSCEVWDNAAASNAGFIGGDTDTQWLVSDVIQYRGEIKPGITKALTSLTDMNGKTVQNPSAVYPTDTLNWTITAANDGNQSMVDYVLTDTMQSPYLFSGSVEYTVKANTGLTVMKNFSDSTPLFSFEAADQDTVTLKYYNGNWQSPYQTAELTVNGDSVTLKNVRVRELASGGMSYYGRTDLTVQLTRDSTTGAYTLSIRFPNETCAIPAGGTGELTISTKRTDQTLENKVYTNTCYVTPTGNQAWDNTTNKGNVTYPDIPGQQAHDKISVRNSAQVASAYGDVTTSVKSIAEKGNAKNSATSRDATNYISLDDKTKLFTYTLEVDNTERRAMKHLVLIDSLPDVDDHSVFQTDDLRFSAFRVSLAEEPNLTVTVTDGDGQTKTLTGSQYTVEYNTDTNREFTNEDWDGTKSSAWSGDSTGARALRVVINDKTGATIPKKAVIKVTFDAKIDGDAKPDTIAWNSFGYHYQLVGDNFSMEAAPLKVGIKIPPVPTAQKILKDEKGNVYKAEQDTTYKVLVYSGSNLKKTGEELYTALAADAKRKATVIELMVKEGESQTEKIQLDALKTYTYADGAWTATETDWVWANNTLYNAVEMTESLKDNESFLSINKDTTNGHFSLRYTTTKGFAITVVNEVLRQYRMPKTGGPGTDHLTALGIALMSMALLGLALLKKKGGKAAGILSILLLSTALTSLDAQAAQVDPAQKGSISLTMLDKTVDPHTVVSGGEFRLYQVAELKIDEEGNGYYSYTNGFEGTDLSLRTQQDLENSKLPAALQAKISATAVSTDGTVDAEGKLSFANLSTGLYLLVQTKAAEHYELVNPFVVSIPLRDEQTGVYSYDVTATPKVSAIRSQEGMTESETESESETEKEKESESETEKKKTTTTNTLPQTGQLNWPIPVLAAAGLLLFALGWSLRRERPSRND